MSSFPRVLAAGHRSGPHGTAHGIVLGRTAWGGNPALALSLPLEIGAWYTIQSIAYGVVLFSIFAQTPMLEPIFRRLHIDSDE